MITGSTPEEIRLNAEAQTGDLMKEYQANILRIQKERDDAIKALRPDSRIIRAEALQLATLSHENPRISPRVYDHKYYLGQHDPSVLLERFFGFFADMSKCPPDVLRVNYTNHRLAKLADLLERYEKGMPTGPGLFN